MITAQLIGLELHRFVGHTAFDSRKHWPVQITNGGKIGLVFNVSSLLAKIFTKAIGWTRPSTRRWWRWWWWTSTFLWSPGGWSTSSSHLANAQHRIGWSQFVYQDLFGLRNEDSIHEGWTKGPIRSFHQFSYLGLKDLICSDPLLNHNPTPRQEACAALFEMLVRTSRTAWRACHGLPQKSIREVSHQIILETDPRSSKHMRFFWV